MTVTGTTRGRSVLTVALVGSLVALSVLLATSHPPRSWSRLDAASAIAELEARPGPVVEGPGGQRWRSRTSEFGMEKMRVPSVDEVRPPGRPPGPCRARNGRG